MAELVPVEYIERRIVELRGAKVIIGPDLAELYGVATRRLNEQVRRNSERFPEDFVFQLTQEEKEEVVANYDHLANLRFSPHLPLAFTEHGAMMAANDNRNVPPERDVEPAMLSLAELSGSIPLKWRAMQPHSGLMNSTRTPHVS